jgi:hypothetical protein
MSWKQIEKPRTVIASKALVKEFAEMEPAPYDRPLSERRLQVYERILRNGEFRTVIWASAVCVETGAVYRVNGKHTAVLLSKQDPLPEFHVTVERYQCDRLSDVAKLYNTFDSNLSSRTVSDINAAFAATLPEIRGVPHRMVNLAVGAVASAKWSEGELRRIPPAERAEELVDNTDFVLWLHSFLPAVSGSGPHRHIVRLPVVQAMYSTFRKAKNDSDKFWRAVKEEDAPDRDDPSRVLARYLVRVAMGGGRVSGLKEGKKLVTGREIYVKCLHAWNAWRKGETTALNYHPKSPVPAVK